MNLVVIFMLAYLIYCLLNKTTEHFGSTSPGTLLQLATSRPYYNMGYDNMFLQKYVHPNWFDYAGWYDPRYRNIYYDPFYTSPYRYKRVKKKGKYKWIPEYIYPG
jgi:hypothetical protein